MISLSRLLAPLGIAAMLPLEIVRAAARKRALGSSAAHPRRGQRPRTNGWWQRPRHLVRSVQRYRAVRGH